MDSKFCGTYDNKNQFPVRFPFDTIPTLLAAICPHQNHIDVCH
jgi:hypothetical protein